jgi:phosphate transport system protein
MNDPIDRPPTAMDPRAGLIIPEPIGERLAMVPTSADRHPPREGLDRSLREVKDGVLRMGSLAEAQIRAAIDALVAHDAAAALAVIKGDQAVNDMQRQITGLIATTIAMQGPVARDLRFLLSLDHVVYELERIADHASSVAKQARLLAPEPPLKDYVDLPRMGRLAAELVHGILRALVDIDPDMARNVARADDDIDALHHRIFDAVVGIMQADSTAVERGTRIILASHYIERIGDRVTNIAEDIVFLASGDVEDLNP